MQEWWWNINLPGPAAVILSGGLQGLHSYLEAYKGKHSNDVNHQDILHVC